MPPESRKLLADMLAATKEIQSFTANVTYEQYAVSQQLRWSVERGFEIIGEALTQLRKIDPTLAEGITDWRAIIGFRNVLIHTYSSIHHDKTWDIVQNELPVLRAELEALLPP
jgi:uncharacterized protein with HEPN domain